MRKRASLCSASVCFWVFAIPARTKKIGKGGRKKKNGGNEGPDPLVMVMQLTSKKVRPWGKTDKEKLHNLINTQQIDITKTSLSNIEQVWDIHFHHCNSNNFRRNFCDFSAAWDLKIKYSGARRNGGKMQCLLLLIYPPGCVL